MGVHGRDAGRAASERETGKGSSARMAMPTAGDGVALTLASVKRRGRGRSEPGIAGRRLTPSSVRADHRSDRAGHDQHPRLRRQRRSRREQSGGNPLRAWPRPGAFCAEPQPPGGAAWVSDSAVSPSGEPCGATGPQSGSSETYQRAAHARTGSRTRRAGRSQPRTVSGGRSGRAAIRRPRNPGRPDAGRRR